MQHNTCACVVCVPTTWLRVVCVWFELEWLINWILCRRVVLIVSIVVIADNGTWAVSVLCLATVICVSHVGVWTIAHRNVVRIKVALYIWPCLPPAAYCCRTNKVCTKQQATDVTFWTVRRGNMRSDGLVQFWIPSDNCFNPLNPELNPICYLLALLAHHFLHVGTIMVKSLTLRLLMSYGAHILDVSRSHTTTHHSR